MPISIVDARSQPVDEIVERCEWLLANAKNGSIRELSFVCMLGNQGGYDTWSSASDDSVRQIGQIYRLVHRMQRNMDGQMRVGADEPVR